MTTTGSRSAQALGPSPEWIAAYETAYRGDEEGYISIAPAPEFAWCCEQILGGYSPDIVISACRDNDDAWQRVRELHTKILNAKKSS